MKAKLKGAEQGHSLLKRKSEALTKYVDNLWSAGWNLILTLCFSGVSEVCFAVHPTRRSSRDPRMSNTEQKSRGESMRPRERWAE